MSDDYPWFARIHDGSIAQGDILLGFPQVVNQSSLTDLSVNEVKSSIRNTNAIIVSQSCDLLASKIVNVILCPIHPPEVVPQVKEAGKKGIQKIHQGSVHSLFMLPEIELQDYKREKSIVNFREAFTAPFALVEAHLKAQEIHVRFLPPYRESLSQAFGRFVMRVGWEKDPDF